MQVETSALTDENEDPRDDLDGKEIQETWIHNIHLNLIIWKNLCFHLTILDNVGEDQEGEEIALQLYPWEGSDRDYQYEEV